LYKFPFYTYGKEKVGHGFSFTNYFVGNWGGGGQSDLGDGQGGLDDGKSDMIGRQANGNLFLYKFPFYNGKEKVGHGFNFTNYFVGNWTGGAMDDLIVFDDKGERFLYLYKFMPGGFVWAGHVAHGVNFTHHLVGKW